MNYASTFFPPPALSELHLLTRFLSLLPPSSVNQRRSDKIRPLTLFVFTLAPLYSVWSMQSGILWLFMRFEWSLGWLGGCGERVIKVLVCLNVFLLVRAGAGCRNSHKSMPDKPGSDVRGGVYR